MTAWGICAFSRSGSSTGKSSSVRGRDMPDAQGWYSPEMSVRLPNTCACYNAEIPHTTSTAWLLSPGKGPVPEVPVTRLPAPDGALHLLLSFPGHAPVEVAMRLELTTPLRLTTGDEVTGHCSVLQ